MQTFTDERTVELEPFVMPRGWRLVKAYLTQSLPGALLWILGFPVFTIISVVVITSPHNGATAKIVVPVIYGVTLLVFSLITYPSSRREVTSRLYYGWYRAQTDSEGPIGRAETAIKAVEHVVYGYRFLLPTEMWELELSESVGSLVVRAPQGGFRAQQSARQYFRFVDTSHDLPYSLKKADYARFRRGEITTTVVKSRNEINFYTPELNMVGGVASA